MLACEKSVHLRQRVTELAAALPAAAILDRSGIAASAASGMTVGFHTVDHEFMPALTDPALQDAVSRGRADLAGAAGTAVNYFAYPDGKADSRTAAAVCRLARIPRRLYRSRRPGAARRRPLPARTVGTRSARSGRPARQAGAPSQSSRT